MKANSDSNGQTPPLKRRFRSAPKVWQEIIASIVDDAYLGDGITYDMIESACANAGHSITREALHVKMARYKKSGYIKPALKDKKRVRGEFWLTNAGKLFFNLESRNKGNQKPKTAMLPTSPSKWGQKARNIHSADATAK